MGFSREDFDLEIDLISINKARIKRGIPEEYRKKFADSYQHVQEKNDNKNFYFPSEFKL